MCIYYYLLCVCVLFSILVRTRRFSSSPASLPCGLFIVCLLCLFLYAAVVASLLLYLLLSSQLFLKWFKIGLSIGFGF